MKFIRKSREPKALRDWNKNNRGGPNESNYAALDVKDILRIALRNEQGDLCAYTMSSINNRDGSHIEHIQPQKHFRHRATDYRNMVLCVPESGPCEWGAIAKGDLFVDESNFVSPLNARCENRFRYRLSGEVVPMSESDHAAKNTIKILNLNHEILVRARREALQSQGIVPTSKGLSAAKARRLSKEILSRDTLGRFLPYCVAVSQAATRIAHQSETRARRLAAKPAD